MARPGKTTVDYFPHVIRTGKTIAILEARWGNNGYAFWFKILELLGNSAGFCYHCDNPSDWEYLLSKTRMTEDDARDILDKLAEIDAIDAELWQERIIWSEHFANNLGPVFEKRKCPPPKKPELLKQKPGLLDVCETASDGNSGSDEFPVPETDKGKQSVVEETTVDESTSEKNAATENLVSCASVPDCVSRLRTGAEQQADAVYLKPAEAASLAKAYGAGGFARIVAILDDYKTNHPDKCAKYRDDYKVILAWVISRYLGERGQFIPKSRRGTADASPPIRTKTEPAAQVSDVRPFFGSLADALRKRLEAREQSAENLASQEAVKDAAVENLP